MFWKIVLVVLVVWFVLSIPVAIWMGRRLHKMSKHYPLVDRKEDDASSPDDPDANPSG